MESNIQITIKGVQEELAINIGNAIGEAIKAFKRVDEDIDFRRMHRIIITSDFAGELAELSSFTTSGHPITYTDEEYAIAVAKVLILPRDDKFEILLIINANVAAALAPEDPEGYKTENFHTVLHLLHHELCHVHDGNKRLDVFQKVKNQHRYTGKERFTYDLAALCWAEYIANYLSFTTAEDFILEYTAEMFIDAINRTKQSMDEEIIKYRYHGNLDQLIDVFYRHGKFLLRIAAYVLGYVDGFGKELSELSIMAYDSLSGSYFESIWIAMQTVLRNMRENYPDGWKEGSVFDELAYVMEDYFKCMGLILSTTQNGEIYVDIPFRPETMPF